MHFWKHKISQDQLKKTETMNRMVTVNEIKPVIKRLQKNKSPGPCLNKATTDADLTCFTGY